MKYRGRHIPWYVWLCMIFAFFGGGFTVLLCVVAFMILVVVNTLIWFVTAGRSEDERPQ